MNWKKVKSTLEWVHLAKVAFDVAAFFISLQFLRALFKGVLNVPPGWASAISWSGAAVVLFGLSWWQQKRPSTAQAQVPQNTSGLLASSSTFNADRHFAEVYRSPFESEVEHNVRTAAQVNSPNDHESFYVKLIATGLVSYTYDIVWAYVFRSQILLLMELNRRMMPAGEVKTAFYDKAAAEYPESYSGYSFEQWMDFLSSHILLISHPSGMVELTLRGKDFLKYLTHWGRYPEQRTL